MRTRAATAKLIRSQLEFSGDAVLRGHIWVDVRTAYSETLQGRAAGARVSDGAARNKAMRLAAAAVLALGLLVLAARVMLRETPSRPEPVATVVMTREPNAGEIVRPQTLPARELAEARRLFEARDLAGLVRLLDTGGPDTQIRVAEYLGQIGDDSVLPALQRLAAQWQGPAEDNPFRKAMEAIQARRTKTSPQPAPGASDPNRAASTPVEKAGAPATSAVKPWQVTGLVLDQETRKPIAGAQVAFGPDNETVADAQGRFTLVQARPFSDGAYLYAGAPGYANSRIALRMKKGGVQDVVLTLNPGSRLAVTVVDPNGSPVPGAKLVLVGLQSLDWDFATDAGGQFEVEGLDPGVRSYTLAVSHPAYPSASVTFQPPEAGQTRHQNIVLKSGVAIFGQVTDPKGRPVAGVTVGNTTSPTMWSGRKVKTDEAGMYQLGVVDRGELVLWATHQEFCPFVLRTTLDGHDARRRLDIQLSAGRALVGQVVDDLGHPLPQATIQMWGYNGLISLLEAKHPCDAEGRFTIPNAPGAGDLDLYVRGQGIAGTHHKVDFGRTECLITIPRRGRIYGRVVDATGAPVPHFRVMMDLTRAGTPSAGFAASWTLEGHVFEAADGLFDTGAEQLATGGMFRMTVRAEGYEPMTVDPVVVQPISDRPVRCEFRLRPAAVFAGRVLATDGRPIEGATVVFFSDREMRSNSTGRWPSATTDKAGVYMISGLGSEPQGMLVSAPGFGLGVYVMAELVVAAGRLGDITLTPAARVVGRVVDEHGKGIADVKVEAAPSLERIWRVLRRIPDLGLTVPTNEEGGYELPGLPAGRVSIFVYLRSQKRMVGREVVELKSGETMTLNFVDEGKPADGSPTPSGRGP